MSAFWRVALQEYRRNVFKKSFLLVLFSVPIFIAFSMGLGYLVESLQNDPSPVGVVDLAGVIHSGSPSVIRSIPSGSGEPRELTYLLFPDADSARSALEQGTIQAYYLLPADYRQTRRIELYYFKPPGEEASVGFWNFLQENLATGQSEAVTRRAGSGTEMIVRSLSSQREVPADNPSLGVFMPLLLTFVFLFILIMSSGYMMGAVTEEKENRTMEVLLTSVSTQQLIGGKVLGILGISLTLVLGWSGVVFLAILGSNLVGLTWFQDLHMDWGAMLSSCIIAVPAYVLVTALMTAIGSMVTTTHEGQSLSSIFFILHAIPLYISMAFVEDPGNTLAVVLSFLPFTALMTVGMRNLFSIVPTWQILTSAAIQTVCALGALWLAGKAFRTGMLRFGQRLTWRSLLRSRD